MKRIGSMLSLLLVAAASHAASDDATDADRVHVTESGNTVSVDRSIAIGPEGGRVRGRDVTVTNPGGEIVGERGTRRFRTADGDTGVFVGREWTDDEGRTHRAASGRRVDADGNVTRGRAREVRGADGDRVAGRTARTTRTAEGARRTVQRGGRTGENASVSGRRVVRSDGNGSRTVRATAARRPN